MTDYTDLKARLVSASIAKIVPGDASPSLEAEAAAAIAALEAERDALREYHEEIVHQFAGVSGHLATIIAKAALGDKHMKAIVEEIRKDRAALTAKP